MRTLRPGPPSGGPRRGMNYEVPKDVDVTKFKSIVIWCEITRNAYAAASIQQ